MLLSSPGIHVALGTVLTAVLCCGCGGNLYETASVTGTVLCNGKPAEGGFVIFQPVDDPNATGRPPGNPGRISRGMVGQDGSFTLVMDPRGAEAEAEGALIGPHQISFVPPRTEPATIDPSDLSLPAEDQEQIKAELAKIPVFEPLECGPDGITPAQIEVKAGDNSFEFTLKPGGVGPAPRVREQPVGSS